MKRIAAPMIGGLATSFFEPTVHPAIFGIWKGLGPERSEDAVLGHQPGTKVGLD